VLAHLLRRGVDLAQAGIRNLDLTTRPAGLINHLTDV
jgi:hypothetical protein